MVGLEFSGSIDSEGSYEVQCSVYFGGKISFIVLSRREVNIVIFGRNTATTSEINTVTPKELLIIFIDRNYHYHTLYRSIDFCKAV